MKSDIIKNCLMQLGFDELEIDLYLLIFKSKKINVTSLANELDTNRPRIYSILDKFLAINLVLKDENGLLSLESPSKITSLLLQKKYQFEYLHNTLTEVLPDINKEFHSIHRQPFIKIYEGKQQIINSILEILDEAIDEIVTYGNPKCLFDLVDRDFHNQWSMLRAKKGVRSKLLIHNFPEFIWSVEKAKEHLREYKFLPEGNLCQGLVYVYSNTVVMINPVVPKAIKIEDKIIADTHRQMFNNLWDGIN